MCPQVANVNDPPYSSTIDKQLIVPPLLSDGLLQYGSSNGRKDQWKRRLSLSQHLHEEPAFS